jgi:ADP-ribose pyrophosphatase YjhB (NUDIX family)/SAM-dependent methyltransferase
VSDGDLAPLAADDDGNLLVAFHEVGEDADLRDAPLPASLVALWSNDGRLLLVFDRRRRCWELPGGMIDVGETPRQAAVRELREETGYQIDDLLFAGFARFVLGPERRAEYAAVYAGRAAAGDHFVPNDEVAAITWWDGTAPLAGGVQPLDTCLGRLARAGLDRCDLGRVFNEVPELYDRVRPGYPDELFADLAAITGMDERSAVLEVGCGTGQATRGLAALGCPVTAVEPGAGIAALARRRLAAFRNVEVETSTFEKWDDRGRRFDVLVAAAAWHWVDPSIGWRRAHEVLHPRGWMALLGNIVVRRPGEPEVYAETADLHERLSPGNPDWGHPPLEDDVRTTTDGWGLVRDPGALFGPTNVRWYPSVQWFDGASFADLLRTNSIYRKLDHDVRERLLDAIAERIRTRMDDRAPRRYLTVLRVGQRTE